MARSFRETVWGPARGDRQLLPEAGNARSAVMGPAAVGRPPQQPLQQQSLERQQHQQRQQQRESQHSLIRPQTNIPTIATRPQGSVPNDHSSTSFGSQDTSDAWTVLSKPPITLGGVAAPEVKEAPKSKQLPTADMPPVPGSPVCCNSSAWASFLACWPGGV